MNIFSDDCLLSNGRKSDVIKRFANYGILNELDLFMKEVLSFYEKKIIQNYLDCIDTAQFH
jgi:hypothetical protein